jgi:hypothetical protein
MLPPNARPKCGTCGGFLPLRAGAVMPCPHCAATQKGNAAAGPFFARGTEQIEQNYPAVPRNPAR